MPEYISREAAKEALYKTSEEYDEYDKCDRIAIVALNNADEMLNDIPAADVVEVVHASWMAENSRPKSGIFYCSCCHRTCYDPQPTRAKGWTKRCRYHYCPSCGAKMDGGQDDGQA